MVLRLWSSGSPAVRCCWRSRDVLGGYAIALCVGRVASGLGCGHLVWSGGPAEAHTARCALSLESVM